MNNKPQQMGVPIGTSLLLVVFVLLALITFATLSYVSADTDNKLSQSVADTTKEYYAAESKAHTTLMEIHSSLQNLTYSDEDFSDELKSTFPDYTVEMRDTQIYLSFLTVVDEKESILSEILVMPQGDYSITKWQLLYTQEWVSNTEFPVFQ